MCTKLSEIWVEDLRCWIRKKLIQDQDPGANKAPDHGSASATLLLTIVNFKYGNKVPFRTIWFVLLLGFTYGTFIQKK